MVWIVEWSFEGEINISCWSTKNEALSQAAFEIMDLINFDWDLSDPDIETIAREINGFCLNGDYESAVMTFNESQDGLNSPTYYAVYERPILVGVKKPNLILFADPPDDDEEEEEEAPPTPRQPYQATTPGATCRGPCGNYNEHAYADMPNGTFCCYQCKMMSQIFGGSVS